MYIMPKYIYSMNFGKPKAVTNWSGGSSKKIAYTSKDNKKRVYFPS